MANARTIGVIGGSGLYELDGLVDLERVRLDTPFGPPSDEFLVGRLGDARLVFLPRHGRGHRIPPHQVNARANIHGLKQLGVEWIIAVSAVGSMKEEIRPGDLVLVDQFIDRTRARPSTFFEGGVAGHVGFADPVCPLLHGWLAESSTGRVHKSGTYIVIDGPQFSTRAESNLYRSWGVDVIGMTALPEAKLAREAEMCYATIALATDYDCWHQGEAAVTVEQVVAVMRANVARARELIGRALPRIAPPRSCPCATAAHSALMTDPALVPAETRARLEVILGRKQ
jgi:5'-methylthioadenosine phosphorylase